MADPSLYEYPSPLEGYENLASLPEWVNYDVFISISALTGCSGIVTTGPGKKSYVNPQTGVRSKAYERFADPIANSDKNGFDIHVYFNQAIPPYVEYMRGCWQWRLRGVKNKPPLRKSFGNVSVESVIILPSKLHWLDLWPFQVPELRIYKIWEQPIGPHPTGMFEVNLFTPAQFGAFIPWLVINRGPLSALVHPNTGDAERDHSQRATWMGERLPLDFDIFKKMMAMGKKVEKLKAEQEANGSSDWSDYSDVRELMKLWLACRREYVLRCPSLRCSIQMKAFKNKLLHKSDNVSVMKAEPERIGPRWK